MSEHFDMDSECGCIEQQQLLPPASTFNYSAFSATASLAIIWASWWTIGAHIDPSLSKLSGRESSNDEQMMMFHDRDEDHVPISFANSLEDAVIEIGRQPFDDTNRLRFLHAARGESTTTMENGSIHRYICLFETCDSLIIKDERTMNRHLQETRSISVLVFDMNAFIVIWNLIIMMIY